jgi:hypothetical protein
VANMIELTDLVNAEKRPMLVDAEAITLLKPDGGGRRTLLYLRGVEQAHTVFQPVEDVIALYRAATKWHETMGKSGYESNPCLHEDHDECDRECSYCNEACRCGCHAQEAEETEAILSDPETMAAITEAEGEG